MLIQSENIQDMYGLLTAVNQPLPDRIDTSVIYGRKSMHLRDTVAEAAARSTFLVVSGGIGVDSGNLGPMGTEAGYLIDSLYRYQYQGRLPEIRIDTKAKSGIEGAQYATKLVAGLGEASMGTMVAISHPTGSLRLGGLLRAAMRRKGIDTDGLVHHGSGYPFDAENPLDQYEAAREIVRVNSYRDGRRPWLIVPERPTNGMVTYAKSVVSHLKADFKRRGIKNPSTADDTPRYKSALNSMLDASVGVLDPIVDTAHIALVPLEIFINGPKLARATIKEVRAKAGI